MNRSLLEHMRIDRDWFPGSSKLLGLLQERYGYVPSIDKIVNRAWSSLDRDQIQDKGWQWINLEGPWLGYGCKLRVVRRGVMHVPSGVWGEAELAAASVDPEGKLQNMEVRFYMDEDRKVDDAKFKNVLHHELTHAYEYLQRSKHMLASEPESQAFKKIEDSSIRISALDRLGRQIEKKEGFQQTLLRRLWHCLYFCSPLEQNAFIAQIRSELENKAEELSDFRKASEIVEHTQAWRSLKQVKKILDWLKGIQKEENKLLIARWCNAFFGSSVQTANQGLKWIAYELDKFERKLKNRLGKICGELYQNSEEHLKEYRIPRILDPSIPEDLEDVAE